MKTLFVNRKSEITAAIDGHTAAGLKAYRTRIQCNCRTPFNFRYGALIVNDNEVVAKIIRCKACAKGGGTW